MAIQCYGCHKMLARSEMKSCASCKAVVYCSKECQKMDWHDSHKVTCVKISNPQNAIDRLCHWAIMWSRSFMNATIWALDLKKYPGRNKKLALMVFVERTSSKDPYRRYKITGQWFVPVSLLQKDDVAPPETDFVISIEEIATDASSHIRWNDTGNSVIMPSMFSSAGSSLLASLAGPILRHLTETVNHIDAMTMWDATIWLSQRHPSVLPAPLFVMPEEIARLYNKTRGMFENVVIR